MSLSDSVSFLRNAIRADITKTSTSSNAGHRQGHRGHHGCPPFAFSYADGVAIDRGQEDRLSVKDIAMQSPPPSSALTNDEQWGADTTSGGSVRKEMQVFLRAGGPRTNQTTTDDGGRALHRWESLQGRSWGDEVSNEARLATFRSTGGAEVQSSRVPFRGTTAHVDVVTNK